MINTILNIDCIKGMKQIPDASIDMIFCDLPYGVSRNTWDIVIPLEKLWDAYERIIKPNGAILLFGMGSFTAKLILSNEKLYRYTIIWQKTTPTGFLNANKMPLRSHEDIAVFYKKMPIYNPQKTANHVRKVSDIQHKQDFISSTNYGNYKASSYDSTERYPTSIWCFSTDKQKLPLHPTQKPLELCRYAVRTFTREGDTVLDHCCGSGTIPLASAIEKRNFIGMDNGICENKKSEYYNQYWTDIAQKRIIQYMKG